MIKTPVTVGSVGASNYHASSCYPLLLDANFKPLNNECAKEAAKRINMHDELVNMLQDVKDFTDWYYGGKVDGSRPKKPLNEIAKNIGELLERCK